MLDRGRRQWAKIESALVQRFTFSGSSVDAHLRPLNSLVRSVHENHNPAMQRQTAVTVYLKNKQLLLYLFTFQISIDCYLFRLTPANTRR